MKSLLILMFTLLGLSLSAQGADAVSSESKEKPTLPIAGEGRAVARSYVLKPNDVVQVKVFGEDELETKDKIESDGTVRFPYLGKVAIGSNTVEQAIEKFEKLLKDGYLVHPQVRITLIDSAKKTVTVLGQVAKQGPFPISEEEGIPFLDAIGLAGGLTNLGDLNDVKIRRSGDKKDEQFKIKSLQKAGKELPKVYPGDTITVGERIF